METSIAWKMVRRDVIYIRTCWTASPSSTHTLITPITKPSTPHFQLQIHLTHHARPPNPIITHSHPPRPHRIRGRLQNLPDVLRLHVEMARYVLPPSFFFPRGYILLLDSDLTPNAYRLDRYGDSRQSAARHVEQWTVPDCGAD
jgi:hypothetical protein